MVRPRVYSGTYKTLTILIHYEHSELYKKAEEYAKAEGISVTSVIMRALAEFLERHHPSTPHFSLPAPTKSTRVQEAMDARAKVLAKEVSYYIQYLRNMGLKFPFSNRVLNRLPRRIEELAKVNSKLQRREYDSLIQEGLSTLKVVMGEPGATQLNGDGFIKPIFFGGLMPVVDYVRRAAEEMDAVRRAAEEMARAALGPFSLDYLGHRKGIE